MKPPERVVLFDGVCNLCNKTVQFILLNERQGDLHFAPLQGETARALLSELWQSANLPDSVIFIDRGKVYAQSDAALQIARYLRRPYPLLSVLRVFPRPLRDAVYDWIARNRYRWFGKEDQCMLPRPEWRSRFLS